ncbi:MAG: hypothetical protein NT018_13185 [Armatimonadetes bacterium]|nr:hypothetical protein [Armatimonadota bacterium]
MKQTRFVFICVCLILLAGAAYCGTATSGYTGYSWVWNSNVYTFYFWINGIPGDSADKIIAWEFAPSNLASPGVWSTADPYWHWDSKKLVLKIYPTEKYKYGAALMPGETLEFTYKLADGVTPQTGDPSFIAHVSRTPGLSSSGDRWIDVGDTWFDNSKQMPRPPYNLVPEPSALLALSSAIFLLGCLRIKRVRV